MKLAAFLFLVGLLLSGCGSTIAVRSDEPFNNDRVFNYAQVRTRLEGSSASVALSSGAFFEGDSLHFSRDSVSFIAGSDSASHTVALQDVSRLVYTDHSAGALSGGLLGTLIGAGSGAAVLFLITDDSADSRLGAAVLELGAMGMGAVIGAAYGSWKGTPVEYRFEHAN